MSRPIIYVVLLGVFAANALPTLGDAPLQPASADEEVAVDASWYYQPSTSPTEYQPNPKAIIHRKALDRAAQRAYRLESKYASGILPARPTVNPLNGAWQYTYPVGYVYGPPIVSNDWGNTQVSMLGDGNRTTAPWSLGARPGTTQGGRPNYDLR